jgi:hypothetical protein
MHTLLTLAVFTCSAMLAGTADDRPTLAGVIQDDKGKPVAGASVFISAAGPRQGVGVL